MSTSNSFPLIMSHMCPNLHNWSGFSAKTLIPIVIDYNYFFLMTDYKGVTFQPNVNFTTTSVILWIVSSQINIWYKRWLPFDCLIEFYLWAQILNNFNFNFPIKFKKFTRTHLLFVCYYTGNYISHKSDIILFIYWSPSIYFFLSSLCLFSNKYHLLVGHPPMTCQSSLLPCRHQSVL